MAKLQGRSRTQLVTPHAMLLVWNYVDRISSWNAGATTDTAGSVTPGTVNAVEPVIISTVSLQSISTVKQKAAPGGQFTIKLAPTKNWVSTLSPGSWCALLMSQEKITEADVKRVDPRKLKMFGRIQSVRTSMNIDQDSGARITSYTVIGEDWGAIYTNKIYLDPLAINESDKTVGGAAFLEATKLFTRPTNQELPSSTNLVQSLISFWGQSSENIIKTQQKGDLKDVKVAAQRQFTLPQAVATYLNLKVDSGSPTNMADVALSHLQAGILQSNGSYDIKTLDSIGYFKPQDLAGLNTIWSLMNEHCNPVLNELFCDLDFEGDAAGGASALLRTWKRIKPFCISKANEDRISGDEYLNSITPEFPWLEKTSIPGDQVIAFEAGTNWRDKYNFAEIRLSEAYRGESLDNFIKLESQIYDDNAFQREGFRPIFETARAFIPFKENSDAQAAESITLWKYLLKEWYFDLHRMLNGTLTLIGQSRHIKVGQNILVPVRALSETGNFNEANAQGLATHILAHVEAISHNFTVDTNGARKFVTTINFVRGIFTDSQGRVINNASIGSAEDRVGVKTDSRISKETSAVSPSGDKNRKTTFGTSTKNDPDPQKLRGK